MESLLSWLHEKRIDIERALLSSSGFRVLVAIVFLALCLSLLAASVMSGFPDTLKQLGSPTWRSYITGYWSSRPLFLLVLLAILVLCNSASVSQLALRRWVSPVQLELSDYSRDRTLDNAAIVITCLNCALFMVLAPLLHLIVPNWGRLLFFGVYLGASAATYHSVFVAPQKRDYQKPLARFHFNRPLSYNTASLGSSAVEANAEARLFETSAPSHNELHASFRKRTPRHWQGNDAFIQKIGQFIDRKSVA